MTPKIFISYNPDVEIEQSTALRLQTLSSLYNAVVHLPDRSGTTNLKDNTKQRIQDAMVFVMFSTHKLSKMVQDEVNYALQINKRVIIFYDKRIGKNLDTSKIKNANLLERVFDPAVDNPADLLNFVIHNGGFLSAKPDAAQSQKKQADNKSDSTTNAALAAIVGVGLGLLLLWAISDDEEPKKKRRS